MRNTVSMAAIVLCVCLTSAGCDSNVYTVELKPTPDGRLDRSLAAYNKSGNTERRLSDAELEKIAATYPASGVDIKATVARFHAVFSDRLPDDVGGSGSFKQWKTPLGAATIYLERVRGDDDVLKSVERRNAIAKWWCDLIARVLAAELPDDPAAKKLGEFVGGPMQRDLTNLSLICWARQFAGERNEGANADLGGAIVAQCAQYLIDRKYIALGQLPEFRKTWEPKNWPTESILNLIRPALAQKISLADGESWKELERLLSDKERITSAIFRAVQTTNEFQAAQAREEKADIKKTAGNLTADLMLRQGMTLLAIQNPLFTHDEISVSLQTDIEPLQTNGRWDADRRAVSWRMTTAPRSESSSLPSEMLYAVWTAHDAAAQTKLLGGVTLTGQDLMDYCLWAAGLNEAQQQEWNRMLETVGPKLEDRLRLDRFRFAGEGKVGGEETAARPGAIMLLNAMRRERVERERAEKKAEAQ